MNILTFDIEEWAIEKAKTHNGNSERYAQFDKMLNQVLELLDQNQVQTTCFCTGKMAEEFPHVVRLIANHGHEIACHSHNHQWCNKMTIQEFYNDTHQAIDTLEQCIGKKILGYRAPAFSITEKNPYAFEILHQHGIIYDASVFPCHRDFGGFPTFGYQQPTRIQYNGIELYEFPIPIANILGKKMAWSGGGYFRILPYPIIKECAKKSDYIMSYFHLNDLISEPMKLMSRQRYEEYFKEPGTLTNRISRMIKGAATIGNTYNKLTKLIQNNQFINIETAIAKTNWNKVPIKLL